MAGKIVAFLTNREYILVALLAPLLLFPGEVRGLVAVAIIPILWGLRWLNERHFIRPTPLDLTILLLLVMVAVSLVITVDWELTWPKATGVILGVAA